MAMSDYLESVVLNTVLNSVPFSEPVSVWVALFTAAPNDAGGGTEVSGVSYDRVEITAGFSTDDLDTRFSNDALIVFPAAGAGGWGTIVAVGLYDSDAGGSDNLLFHGTLTDNRTVLASDVFQFAIDDFGVTIS